MASAQLPAYIDFPGTCEIKINGETVNANTKGIKKQPGTAPPVDLGKPGSALSLAVEVINKIEMVYVNTEKVRPGLDSRGRIRLLTFPSSGTFSLPTSSRSPASQWWSRGSRRPSTDRRRKSFATVSPSSRLRRDPIDPSSSTVIAINTDVDVVATAYGLSLKDPVRPRLAPLCSIH